MGSRAKYKNFELTIKAISQSNLNLVIVGAPLNKHEQKLVHQYLKKRKEYTALDILITKDLISYTITLLHCSTLLSMKVLEFQYLKLKSRLSSHCLQGSSIPEIIGDDTLLINESSTSEIQRCISILQDEQQRTNIIKKGLKNTQRFSWDKMYDSVLAIYKEAWNSK